MEKLKEVCEPLVAHCLGKSRADNLNKTMSTLITRNLRAKDEKDNYRMSVSSTILFVLNRISKERSHFQKELVKIVKLFKQPGSSNIEVSVIGRSAQILEY